LRHQPETESRNDVDWDGVAAVLIGATFHYWFLRDTFRTHPPASRRTAMCGPASP
jgi:hypothetical protein